MELILMQHLMLPPEEHDKLLCKHFNLRLSSVA